MKQKWLGLTIPQRVIFCLQVILIVLFLILYNTVGKQQVLRYQDTPLRFSETDETAVYSGKMEGIPVSFAVSENKVEYRHGDKTILYTVTEDPTAVPAKESMEQMESLHEELTGVEVRKDGKLLFRGAWLPFSDRMILFEENGEVNNFWAISIAAGGTTSNGVIPDPGGATILGFLYAPDVVQRANFLGLVGGIFLCVVCMVTLLFVDELFRWNLRFSIRNVEDAEPSEWELCSRWMGWLTFTCLAVIVFIMGLTGR